MDRSTWLDSYNEEKQGLLENDTYVEISLQEYRRLCRLPKAVPKAIQSICVMAIKRNENMAPVRAKSRICSGSWQPQRPLLGEEQEVRARAAVLVTVPPHVHGHG